MTEKFTIGQMRQSVMFLANVPTVLGAGKKDSYVIFLVTRGRLRKHRGNRDLSFGIVESVEKYDLICRFQSALESSIRVDTKIVIDGRTFTPASWDKIDQINHLYKFTLNTSTEQISADDYPGLGIGTFVVS